MVGLETTAREKSGFFSATPSEGRTLLIGILAPKDPESQFYGFMVHAPIPATAQTKDKSGLFLKQENFQNPY